MTRPSDRADNAYIFGRRRRVGFQAGARGGWTTYLETVKAKVKKCKILIRGSPQNSWPVRCYREQASGRRTDHTDSFNCGGVCDPERIKMVLCIACPKSEALSRRAYLFYSGASRDQVAAAKRGRRCPMVSQVTQGSIVCVAGLRN